MKKLSISLVMILTIIVVMNQVVFAAGESGSINSAGYGNTYVVKSDGALWGWGGEYSGNGNGNREKQITPVKILDNVRSVSTGTFVGVAVKTDDTLWGWGYGLDGYPAGAQDATYLSPVKLNIDHVKMAASGLGYILALKNDNSLWACGDIYTGDGSDVKANGTDGFKKICDHVIYMHAGKDTVYLIKEDNTLWAYGNNSCAQLGNMTTSGDTNTAAELSLTKILDDVKYVTACPDGNAVLAIRLDESLYGWGNKGFYAEAYGWVEDAGKPYKIMDNVKNVAVDGDCAFIVKTDNTLWGWGYSYEGKSVSDEHQPYKITDNVLSITLGERHASVIKTDNTLWTMGGNYRGGLGYDSDETWYTPLTKILDNVKDSPASWAMEEVEKAIGEKLIPADMQNNYTQPITREEFCILAIRMIEVKSDMSIDTYLDEVSIDIAPSNTFVDCNTNEVLAAKALGIVKGTSETTFDPDMLLNREMAAVFLTRTAQACGRDVTLSTPNYVDADKISAWAKEHTGYVYDIGVLKGTTGNRFDPKGSYQRQQAFMTMYRIWNAIDRVDTDKVKNLASETVVNNADVSLQELKKEISNEPYHTDFIVNIEGTSKDAEDTVKLKYDVYYKNADIKIDTYYDNRIVSNCIYNDISFRTYTCMTMGSQYAEVLDGNFLPIRFLNIESFDPMQNDPEVKSFNWCYETLDSEKVLYTQTVMTNGVTTEQWYSLKYSMPIKFHQEWLEDGSLTKIDWKVTSIDENVTLDDVLFDIPMI